MTRTQIRIVSGSLRGRALAVDVHPGLRPTPLRVREALFSILGHAVPDRPFYDLFAGTGVHGLEALSRGGSRAVFVERDGRLASAIEASLSLFQLADQAMIVRGDVYRWAERSRPPEEPVNVFISPPFADFTQRSEEFVNLLIGYQQKLPIGSVLTAQLEVGFDLDGLPDPEHWDVRTYGRNILAFWEPEVIPSSSDQTPPPVL